MIIFLFIAFFCLAVQSSFALSNNIMSTTSPPKNKRQRTSLSLLSSNALEKACTLVERAAQMNDRAKEGAVLTEGELNDVIRSIQNLNESIDGAKLRENLREVAHLSHKDWSQTESNAERLGKILLPNGISNCDSARKMLQRILKEGKWDAAASHAAMTANTAAPTGTYKPWAVLVTGVNGIRKTTSMHQPWFPALLREALVAPSTTGASSPETKVEETLLPTGSNSFFRQLDHIMATLCNEDFAMLYKLTAEQLTLDKNGFDTATADPPAALIQQYSNLKAAIFTRYRTLSELLGACLLKEAIELKSNCLMETSGRDVAMFHYVDHFFPSASSYNKLALHFVINDLSQAQTSVDQRMISEIHAGTEAIQEESVTDIVNANVGGPYGSEVLPGVQQASDRVWKEKVLKNEGGVGQDWYKATIQINAYATKPWTAHAIRADGTPGTEFTFER